MPLIASEDIGAVTARVFADPKAHIARTIRARGDESPVNAVAEKIGPRDEPVDLVRAVSTELLAQNPLLQRIVEFGTAAGPSDDTDISALRRIHPELSPSMRGSRNARRRAIQRSSDVMTFAKVS